FHTYLFTHILVPYRSTLSLHDALPISRKLNETIVIDGSISVTLVGIRGNQVRLGICAPKDIGIYRSELCERGSAGKNGGSMTWRSEEHTSELQSLTNLICRLLLETENY